MIRFSFIDRLRRKRRQLHPPLTLQADPSDCGPASLLSVLRFWGGSESLTVVRELCGTGPSGSRLRGLCAAASQLGLAARAVQAELQDLTPESLPSIAHLTLDDGRHHFVVIYRVRKKRIWLGDPSLGRVRLPPERFEHLWRTRALLLLSPTETLRRRTTEGWPTWLLEHIRAEPAWLAQVLFLGVVTSVLGLFTAGVLQLIVDRHIPEGNADMVRTTGWVLLVLLIVRSGSRYVRQRFLLCLNRSVGTRVNEQLLARLYRLPLRFFEARATGDITRRIADGTRIQDGVLQFGGVAVIDGLLVLGSTIGLLMIARPLGLVALLCLPIYVALLARPAARVRRSQDRMLAAYGQLEAAYVDSLKGISDVLAFGAAGAFARENGGLFRHFSHCVERSGRIGAALGLISELSGGAMGIGSLTWGSLLVISGDLRLGQLIAGYSLLATLLPSTGRLVGSWTKLQEVGAAATRFQDLMLAPIEPRTTTGNARPWIQEGLRLESISLLWPSGQHLFQDLSFSLPLGAVTGIHGRSGAGKTTLVRVLNRTYTASAGNLLVDGVPVEHVGLDAYRAQVAVFHGRTHVFRGTIAENVLLGRCGGREKPVLEGLERLGLLEFLRRFPGLWLERVGEGGRRLSSGERQMIGLMRALVSRPRVLLVDEGLAGTDARLGSLILQVILSYGREHAVLLVSHDPRVLRHAERSFELVDGTIRAAGGPQSPGSSGRETIEFPGQSESGLTVGFRGGSVGQRA